MKYRIYAYGRKKGWLLYDTATNINKVSEVVETIDPYEYDRYMVIRHNIKRNMDETIEYGILQKPKTKRKK